MKKLILIFYLLSTQAISQTIQVFTDTGVKTYNNCEWEVQSHSDTVPISEYWFDCPKQPPAIELGSAVGQSIITINDITTFVCPVETSIFGTGPGFYLFIDCRVKAPDFGHLWIATENGIQFYPECELWKSRHSDDSGYSQYWLTCPENPPSIVIQEQNGYRHSDIWINGAFTLKCPMAESEFGRDNSFYILLVCIQPTIFKNGFEQ